MKGIVLLMLIILCGCSDQDRTEPLSSMNPRHWESRWIDSTTIGSLENSTSYLPIYSEIYSMTQHGTHNLTATVSIRNISPTDSIYISKASYYDTHGVLIRQYFRHPIYLEPLETVEIVIEERDREGGTGANFLFKWSANPGTPDPLFEAVMISTTGQQGLSFTTRAILLSPKASASDSQ